MAFMAARNIGRLHDKIETESSAWVARGAAPLALRGWRKRRSRTIHKTRYARVSPKEDCHAHRDVDLQGARGHEQGQAGRDDQGDRPHLSGHSRLDPEILRHR